MTRVFFTSDLHLGHQKVLKFQDDEGNLTRNFTTIEEHDACICDNWVSLVENEDKIFVLGDVAFTLDGLELLRKLPGRKYLIRGNHDIFSLRDYSYVFEDIYGLYYYKGRGKTKLWLSHAPIHPQELRGRCNVHGHLHHKIVPNATYLNVCLEYTDFRPISLETVKSLIETEKET